ncbi:MAG: murein hydrolase activator EnvC [Dehalococcoidia bacterium]
MPILIGASAAGIVALGVLLLAFTSGGSHAPDSVVSRLGTETSPTPTVDLAQRPGGLLEGAMVLAPNPPVPPPSELRSAGGKRFSLPVKAHAGIEDYFGTPRLYGMRHAGVDFSLVGLKDIAVNAACAGSVESTGESPELGLHIIVDCGDDWSTVYGFLESVSAEKGSVVKPGESIGGGSPGEHLHFEIRYQGEPVDPQGYIDIPPKVLPTATPTPTSTPSPTPRTKPTSVSGGTAGPGAPATATATPKFTPTPTDTPTVTPTPTITPTPTWTPTPTRTPRPPATPTPAIPVSR